MSIFYNVCAGNLDTLIINPMILQCAGIFLVLLVFVFNVPLRADWDAKRFLFICALR